MDGSGRITKRKPTGRSGSAISKRIPGLTETAAVDLNQVLARQPDETYLMKVHSGVMEAAGIKNGDTIIVDRSLEPVNGKIVVASLNGEFFIRKLEIGNGKMQLLPANGLAPIVIDHISYEYIWGVVTYVIHQV